MERDEIIRLVFKATRNNKSRLLGCGMDDLKRFAELVAADEREACAKVLRDKHDELAKRSYPPPKILLEMEGAILGRSNVEFSGTPAALSPEAPLERRVGHGGSDGE